MSISPPIPGIQLFQNLTLTIQGQVDGWGQNSVTTWVQHSIDSHPFLSMSIGLPFLSYDFFKIWPWKSRVKVMGEVTDQSHNVSLKSYWLTSLSFHVNRPSHSWDTGFSKLDHDVAGLDNSIELWMVQSNPIISLAVNSQKSVRRARTLDPKF